MFRALRRYLQRRKLRRAVVALSFELARRYGDREFYTPGQAGAAIAALKIDARLRPYAVVVAVAEDETQKLEATLTSERQAEVRREIAEAFELAEVDFTTRDLRQSLGVRRYASGVTLSDDRNLWGGANDATSLRGSDTPHT